MNSITRCMLLVAVCLVAGNASGQGLLLAPDEAPAIRLPRVIMPSRPRPEPPAPSYRITALNIDASVQDQVAKVQVSQSFENQGSRPMEVCFVFPLPYDGAIDQMTFMVDGKEYPGKLLTAAEARKIYENYVRRNQDPALLEWVGTGMFKTSVFPVPAGATRTVTLRYSQLCRTTSGLTELLLPLSAAKYTSQPVEKVVIRVNVRSQAKIKNVYSPTHAIKLERPSDEVALATFTSSQETPSSDFRLMYDIGDAAVGASVLSYRPHENEDGYFALLVSPEIKSDPDKVLHKNVVFVVDRSGSMGGQKMEQAKEALRFVLNNLREGDLFNIVAYDSTVEVFQPELQRYNDPNRKLALGFVEGLHAGGSTNIDGALKAGLGQLHDDSRPNYLIFLTDGLPTVGEKNEAKIVENAQQANSARTRIFSFGVGFDVNSRTLDKLSRTCFGQSQYVRPNEDIEEHVSRLYARIGAPVLTNLAITFDSEDFPAERGMLVNRVYPKEAYDLFAGDQLVVVGRYRQGGAAKVVVRGTVGDQSHQFDFPIELVKKSADDSQSFVEKLWAVRRVGEILDEIDLQGQNSELIDELVAIATKHGIITPYTSFLADENANLRDAATNRRRAGIALEGLGMESGQSGFIQRELKANFQRADQAPAAASGGGFGGSGIKVKRLADDRDEVLQTVQNVGTKTFFYRNNRWVDSALTEQQERAVQRVERFSQEYFDLISRYGRDVAKYLAVEGEVTVVLDGQAYAF